MPWPAALADFDAPAVVGDDALDDREAQARAAGLGREVRREQPGALVAVRGPGPCRRCRGPGRRPWPRRREAQPAALRHRLQGVRHQVADRAGQQVAVAGKRGQIRRQVASRATPHRARSRYSASVCSATVLRLTAANVGRGMRAKSLNSSTIRRRLRSSCWIVSLDSRNSAAKRAGSRSRARPSVSSETWIGKIGFLSSCARRRAISRQAVTRSACTRRSRDVRRSSVMALKACASSAISSVPATTTGRSRSPRATRRAPAASSRIGRDSRPESARAATTAAVNASSPATTVSWRSARSTRSRSELGTAATTNRPGARGLPAQRQGRSASCVSPEPTAEHRLRPAREWRAWGYVPAPADRVVDAEARLRAHG